MKIIEIRRHSLTGPEGNLSPKGIEIAQKARKTIEVGYVKFLSSPKPRAVQTLAELGGKEIDVDDRFGTLPRERIAPFESKVNDIMSRQGTTLLQTYFEIDETRAILEQKGKEILMAIIDVARSLPEDGKALVVSHGGSIEPAAILAVGKKFSLESIGGELGPCEGIRVFLENYQIKRVDIIRLVD